ncbi:hypothetical protein C8F04DRAFT_1119771 [Mycena alexandri]|uniref:Uncharacterized protein n=1 Tax=Mycena alexandri TaxID=1745969 RepID=A0AAD6X133_9AGAR|nr:hypothetical protein C8F04DRAFT_1119771 [Mycena alexandri]
MSHHQEDTECLGKELEILNKGKLDESSFDWPMIDYKQVSTNTCTEVFQLLGMQPQRASASKTTPAELETPHRVRLARKIDYVLSERVSLAKKRTVDAQDLEDLIKIELPTIFQFLKAARRTTDEHFVFPNPESMVLKSLNAVRAALNAIEDMVIVNSDLDATDADTETGDPDETRVAY